MYSLDYIVKIKIRSSCEIEDFVETHLCKLCVILLRSRVVVVVVLTLSRIVKSVVTGQAPVIPELTNTPGRKHKQTKGGTRIYRSLRNSCLRQKHKKREIGSQPAMCQVRVIEFLQQGAEAKIRHASTEGRLTSRLSYSICDHCLNDTTQTRFRVIPWCRSSTFFVWPSVSRRLSPSTDELPAGLMTRFGQ